MSSPDTHWWSLRTIFPASGSSSAMCRKTVPSAISAGAYECLGPRPGWRAAAASVETAGYASSAEATSSKCQLHSYTEQDASPQNRKQRFFVHHGLGFAVLRLQPACTAAVASLETAGYAYAASAGPSNASVVVMIGTRRLSLKKKK